MYDHYDLELFKSQVKEFVKQTNDMRMIIKQLNQEKHEQNVKIMEQKAVIEKYRKTVIQNNYNAKKFKISDDQISNKSTRMSTNGMMTDVTLKENQMEKVSTELTDLKESHNKLI